MQCRYCRQKFQLLPGWVYKIQRGEKTVYFCRYNHMVAWERDHQRTDGRKGKPVICAQTGEVYPSAAAAAEELGIDENYLRQKIWAREACFGRNYAYLTKKQPYGGGEP